MHIPNNLATKVSRFKNKKSKSLFYNHDMYIGKHSAGVYVDHRQCPGHPDVESWLSKHCSYLLFGQMNNLYKENM